MSLLVVGSVALDSLETPFGRREDVLGGSASYFSTCASFFGPTRMVAVVGEDFPEEHVRFLAGRGIDLAGLSRRPGKTFRWKGRYEFDLNTAHTLDTQLNVFASFQPELPAHYRDSEYVFLGNIDPDLQRAVLDQVKGPRFVGCDTMNYWITSKRESLLKTLKRVDMLFVNDAEARQLAGEHNVVKAARKILSMGPRAVVVKRGEYGALFFSGDEVFAASAVPLPSVFDPTGAGDSFAGGFMGYLARSRREDHATMRRAIVLGSVLASFTVEQFSLDRLRTLGTDEIRARFAEARRLAHFDDLELDLFGANGNGRAG
jgi:sugar/nucleoside kinase (ribokinase family)